MQLKEEQKVKIKEIWKWIIENNIDVPEIKTQLFSFKEIKNKNFDYKNENKDDNIVENFLLYCYSKNYQNLSFTILYNNSSTLLKTDKKTLEQLSLALDYNHYKCVDWILTKWNYTIDLV